MRYILIRNHNPLLTIVLHIAFFVKSLDLTLLKSSTLLSASENGNRNAISRPLRKVVAVREDSTLAWLHFVGPSLFGRQEYPTASKDAGVSLVRRLYGRSKSVPQYTIAAGGIYSPLEVSMSYVCA